jgi:bifunctional non-homologous end joining protein LigD
VTKNFVIQEHTGGDKVHWDFMLEYGSVLKTWRLDTAPESITARPVAAAKIFDHDLKFLHYEGPVNKGQGRVRIADKGTFEILEESEKKLCLGLHGKILFGKFSLEHIDGDQWQFFSK